MTWSRAVEVKREEGNRLEGIRQSGGEAGWWTERSWQRKEESKKKGQRTRISFLLRDIPRSCYNFSAYLLLTRS